MPELMTVDIPPGFRSHGVDLDSTGRWQEGSLVRFELGSLRPVGGWRPLRSSNAGVTADVTVSGAGTESTAPRAVHTWLDNASEQFIAIGSNSKLYAAGAPLQLQDITPSGFSAGVSGESTAYGSKDYGEEAFGTPRTPTGTSTPIAVWSMDNFGEQLVFTTSSDSNIYVWELDYSTPTLATTITKSGTDNPPSCDYLVVTAERFLFALGANNNARLIVWCDREDYTQWDILETTEAGSFELQTAGRILGAVKVRGRTLILTTTDAHVAVYNGPPTVYGFQRVGVNCGVIAPQAMADAQFGAFWMGDGAFFQYDGSTVREIPCEVHDRVFGSINPEQHRKIFAVSNERYQEVWWFYPCSDSLECDRYVAYNYAENFWFFGDLERTCGTDLGVFTDPIWLDYDGNIYRHETGTLHDGADIFAETGPLMLGNGNNVVHATKLLQDEGAANECSVSFSTRFSPDGTEWSHGPYTLGNDTSVRFTGRQVRMRVIGTDSTDWRIGGFRIEQQAGGRR